MFSNHQSDNSIGWRPGVIRWRGLNLKENRYKEIYIKKYIYRESERMFNSYCNSYGLEGKCNHYILSNIIYDKYINNVSKTENELDTLLDILDDSMRWELKPLRKTCKNVGDMTESIRYELESVLS